MSDEVIWADGKEYISYLGYKTLLDRYRQLERMYENLQLEFYESQVLLAEANDSIGKSLEIITISLN